MKAINQPVYHLNGVEVDVSRGCLRRAGQEVYLRRQTFQVLLYLLERRERVVSKAELMDNLWKDTAVTDNVLLQCVMDIRKALGDDPRQPRWIKTIPKSGYRFVGEVTEVCAGEFVIEETEEITAVEVEFREETDGDTSAASTRQPLAVSRHIVRRRLYSALAALLLIGVGLGAYATWKWRQSRRPLVETTLPQVASRKALVVMCFVNQSADAELDWLREGLADMLITDLSRSDHLAVLSRQQLYTLLERIGRQPTDDLRLEETLDIARRSQAEVILLGSFAKLGATVRIEARLHDAANGQLLAAESLTADKPERVLQQIDLLSLKLAAHLGSEPAAQQPKAGLAEVMTDDLEAYRDYTLALSAARAFHSQEAIALLEKAIALDPQFAMARARLGYVYAISSGISAEKGKRYLESAFKAADRLTERDRLYITLWYEAASGGSGSTIQPLREIIKRYPYDPETYYQLSYMLRNEARLEEAIEVIQQGLVIDPEAPDLYNRLGFCLSELGRYDEALAAHRRYVELAPKEANAYDSLGMTYNEMGRYDEALTAFNWALALKPDAYLALVHIGDVYFRQGRYQAAGRQYRHCLRWMPAGYHRSMAYRRLALLALRLRDYQQAEAAARQEVRNLGSFGAFEVAVTRGDLVAAEKMKSQYLDRPGQRPRPPILDRHYNYLMGLLALRRGRDAEALEHFKEALRRPPLVWNVEGDIEDCLANAYLALNRLDEATAEYERVLRLNPDHPLTHYHLAQTYERKGEREQARAHYERFLQLWNSADANLPEILDARARLQS